MKLELKLYFFEGNIGIMKVQLNKFLHKSPKKKKCDYFVSHSSFGWISMMNWPGEWRGSEEVFLRNWYGLLVMILSHRNFLPLIFFSFYYFQQTSQITCKNGYTFNFNKTLFIWMIELSSQTNWDLPLAGYVLK